MKVFLSAIENGTGKYVIKEMENKKIVADYVLISYYYLRKSSVSLDELKRISKEILVDSGAHSFQKGAKNISVAGIYATLGNVMFASNFLATDILSECYGRKYARLAPKIGVFAIIIYLINIQITLMYTPNEIDMVSTSMNNIFQIAPQICLASMITYYLSNYLDVIIYEKLKKHFKDKKLWLRNNIATILCNCSENFGFAFIAFYGTFSVNDILMIAISTSIIEIFIAICDTPFLYLAKFIRR